MCAWGPAASEVLHVPGPAADVERLLRGNCEKTDSFSEAARSTQKGGIPAVPRAPAPGLGVAMPVCKLMFNPACLGPLPTTEDPCATHSLRPGCPGSPLTANIEAGASQNAAVPGMTHQVVPGLLPGPVEVGQGQGQGGGVEEVGQLGGQAAPIKGPVETLSTGPRCISVYRTSSLQGGTNEKSGILGADYSGV